MQFKGTKGKWFIENLNQPKLGKYPAKEIDISAENTNNLCTIWYSKNFNEETKANALLISKAPELLENLNELTQIVNGYIQEQANNHCFPNDIIQKVLKAEQIIKEATELENQPQ